MTSIEARTFTENAAMSTYSIFEEKCTFDCPRKLKAQIEGYLKLVKKLAIVLVDFNTHNRREKSIPRHVK